MKTIASPPPVSQSADLDEWVRHIIEIHFHPTLGTPYWIARAKELNLDARKEIRSYSDLGRLGHFPAEALRKMDVRDFLPAAIAQDRGRLRVHETGGTTGLPSRIGVRDFFVPVNRWMRWYLYDVIGFPSGGNWLFIGPTGPHGIGESSREIAQLGGGICYVIDLDPRFIKLLYQKNDMRTVGLYMEHIRQQAFAILDTQDIQILGTTPVLMQMLAPEIKERGYPLKAFLYGGTQLTKDLYNLLRTQYFPGAVHTAIYGNTLMGGAVMRPHQPDDANVVYYSPEPLVKMEVVAPENTGRLVGMHETGQVCITVLSEERFLPRVLERDQAERWDVLPLLGCEGAANVRPRAMIQAGHTEGVY